MKITELLKTKRGVTALIGSGGKTTLLYTMAGELRDLGSVVICTSTHIRIPVQYPLVTGRTEAVADALKTHRVVCTGTPAGDGKITAPDLSFEELSALADYVLVEADGSRGLPMKAHAPHEPVIPGNAGDVILLVGARGFGRPVAQACHRPDLWASLAGCGLNDPVTPAGAAAVIRAEGLAGRVYINQVETDGQWDAAKGLSALLSCPVLAGSLHQGVYSWLH